jgi:hypothetical protein
MPSRLHHHSGSSRADRPVQDIPAGLFSKNNLNPAALSLTPSSLRQLRAMGKTHMADPPPYPETPRWVRVSGIAVGILMLLIAILIHAGGGPHHNIPSGDAGGHTLPEAGR